MNNWGVPFSHISWLERFLRNHQNTINVSRTKDIVFEVDRKVNKDKILVLCLREYVMSFTAVQKAIQEFGHVDIIYIGGAWCGYTEQAKEFCIDQKIGLYVTNEMTGALWRDEFWNYHQKDRDGNPMYHHGRE